MNSQKKEDHMKIEVGTHLNVNPLFLGRARNGPAPPLNKGLAVGRKGIWVECIDVS
jgi:hypothetical protein